MRTFAVTGGIGSGKSAVCSIIASLGRPVYDSDSAAKRLYDEDPDLLDSIEEAFGLGFRLPGGVFDKDKLAATVFGSKERLSKLNSIVHPVVLRDFVRWKAMNEANGVATAFMESAIILDLPEFMAQVDKVILVDAPLSVRLSRACARDKVSPESVIARMGAQRIDISKADVIVRNAGTVADLKKEVARALRKLGV